MSLLNAEMQANLVDFHPLTFKVKNTRVLDKWKWSNVKKYEGSSDSKAQPILLRPTFFSRMSEYIVDCFPPFSREQL